MKCCQLYLYIGLLLYTTDRSGLAIAMNWLCCMEATLTNLLHYSLTWKLSNPLALSDAGVSILINV